MTKQALEKMKYNIQHELDKLDRKKYKAALKWIPYQLGISERTFLNWRTMKTDQNTDIPFEKLVRLAAILELPSDKLQNYEVTVPYRISELSEEEMLGQLRKRVK